MKPEEALLSEPLRKLGYTSEPAIVALANRSLHKSPHGGSERNLTWLTWEGILGYLAFVEHARQELKSASDHADDYLMVRYHSLAMIFFAQATLDLIAVWLQKHLSLTPKGGELSFNKSKFRRELAETSKGFEGLLRDNSKFIARLEEYRKQWIHRVAGGAILHFSSVPDSEERFFGYAVSPDPSDDFWDPLRRKQGRGRKSDYQPPIPISEFADYFGDGTKRFTLDTLMLSIQHPKIVDSPYNTSDARKM